MAGKFGLDPHQLDDETLERELRYLYTERMLQLEREYANRFPERTRADALRTRKGARGQSGQPTSR
jgi:hypothetical protein